MQLDPHTGSVPVNDLEAALQARVRLVVDGNCSAVADETTTAAAIVRMIAAGRALTEAAQ